MLSKRDVLAHLTRDELLAIIDQYDLSVSDRRVRDNLIDAVAASKKATPAEVLPTLSRDRLKDICRALDLDDSGRETSVLVERLTGAKPSPEPAPTSTPSRPPKANGAGRASAPEQFELALGEKLTTQKLERWSAMTRQ